MSNRILTRWGDTYDDVGCTFAFYYVAGAIAGQVEQFPGNAPTTYATVCGDHRLGPKSSWDDAVRSVEEYWRARFVETGDTVLT